MRQLLQIGSYVYPGRYQSSFRFHLTSIPWRMLPWLIFFLATGSYQFWLGFDYNSNDTTNLYLRLARGAAYLLLLILAVLWLPVMRNGISALRRSRLGHWLPLDQAKACHRWLGHLLMATAILHGSQYLFYYDTLEVSFSEALLGEEPDLVRSMRTNMYEFVSEDESIDIIAEWIQAGAPRTEFATTIRPVMKEDCTKCHSRTSTMTYAIPEMPLSNYEDVVALTGDGIASRQFRINASGLLMLTFFLVIWLSSLQWMRRRYHHRFQRLHRLGYLVLVLALLHIPTVQWLALPLLVLVAELYLSRMRKLYKNCAAQATQVHGDVTRLEIQRPETLHLLPGHYVQLRIPELSRHEWHAFSLTGPRNDQSLLVLKIRSAGDWTRRLQQLSIKNSESRFMVDLRGPFASPAAHAPASSDWLLIAGGIGITPFLSLLRELKRNPDRTGTMHLVWTTRESQLLHWLRPLIERLCETARVNCHWHIYLTGENSDIPGISESFGSAVSLKVQQGRPDWPLLVKEIGDGGCRPDCFICGPVTLAKEAGRACRQMGWSVRKEHF